MFVPTNNTPYTQFTITPTNLTNRKANIPIIIFVIFKAACVENPHIWSLFNYSGKYKKMRHVVIRNCIHEFQVPRNIHYQEEMDKVLTRLDKCNTICPLNCLQILGIHHHYLGIIDTLLYILFINLILRMRSLSIG